VILKISTTYFANKKAKPPLNGNSAFVLRKSAFLQASSKMGSA
jgi:hypothetical protein